MNLEGVADDDIDPGAKGYDAFTDGVVCENAIKFACYVPRPVVLRRLLRLCPGRRLIPI